MTYAEDYHVAQYRFEMALKTMKRFVVFNCETRLPYLASRDHDVLKNTASSLDYIETICRDEWRFALSEPAQDFASLCIDVLLDHQIRYDSEENIDEPMSIGAATALFIECNHLILYRMTVFDASRYGSERSFERFVRALKDVFKRKSTSQAQDA